MAEFLNQPRCRLQIPSNRKTPESGAALTDPAAPLCSERASPWNVVVEPLKDFT
jgi:hypothetical protein